MDKISSKRPLRDGNESHGAQNPNKTLVAATFEKAKTYIFAGTYVWDREVGGSNPLAPTINLNPFNNLERYGSTGLFLCVGSLCPEMPARDV